MDLLRPELTELIRREIEIAIRSGRARPAVEKISVAVSRELAQAQLEHLQKARER